VTFAVQGTKYRYYRREAELGKPQMAKRPPLVADPITPWHKEEAIVIPEADCPARLRPDYVEYYHATKSLKRENCIGLPSACCLAFGATFLKVAPSSNSSFSFVLRPPP